ncbi:DnaD and phage-associated domain-containing protein [Halobacillus karajensis]|uniref:DnaD domain protein n=1 Tax=Halobacillus karajensis TaxID=195088 RepID=UPI0008A77395|nr:DnaD domain protein [Halobacillus karajensis]SEH77864.1 DnaD and phage-associated domain-containing protein [Halobacillus karajensis]
MAKFRQVYTEFWDDAKVTEEMSPEDKLFYLYLLTNPNTTQTGIYQITKKKAAFELGYSNEAINSLFDRFMNYHKLIRYNPETREIAIKNWGKYNLNRGGKPMLDCVKKELGEVKDRTLIHFVGDNVKNASIKDLYDTYHDTSASRGQEKEEEEQEEELKEEEPVRGGDQIIQALIDNHIVTPGGLTATLRDDLIDVMESFDFEDPEEMILEAIKDAVRGNGRTWKFIYRKLVLWQKQGIKNKSQLLGMIDVSSKPKQGQRKVNWEELDVSG